MVPILYASMLTLKLCSALILGANLHIGKQCYHKTIVPVHISICHFGFSLVLTTLPDLKRSVATEEGRKKEACECESTLNCNASVTEDPNPPRQSPSNAQGLCVAQSEDMSIGGAVNVHPP